MTRSARPSSKRCATHLEKNSDSAEFSRARGDLPRLKATLGRAIPALREALSLRKTELNPLVFGLLGRIVSFSRLSRDGDLRKSVEPALQIYLQGLDESDSSIRDDVISRVGRIPIRREEIISALSKLLERTDLPDEVRKNGLRACRLKPIPTARGMTSLNPEDGRRDFGERPYSRSSAAIGRCSAEPIKGSRNAIAARTASTAMWLCRLSST